MCLAVPMEVIERCGDNGKVEQGGVKRQVSFVMLPEAQPGDFVLIHAGFAIERLDPKQAAETMALLHDMLAASKNEPTR